MPDLNQITALIDKLSVVAQKYNPVFELLGYFAAICASLWAVWIYISKRRKTAHAIPIPIQEAQSANPAQKKLSLQELPPSFAAKITGWGGTPGNLKLQLQIDNDGAGGDAYSVRASIPELNIEKNLGDLPRNRSEKLEFMLDHLPAELLITIYYTAIDGTKNRYKLELTGITPHNVTEVMSFPAN